MKHKIISICLIFAAILLFSTLDGTFSKKASGSSFFGNTLIFATEPVPISQTEVYESLDQELLLLSEAKARVYLSLRRIPRTLPIVEKALKDEGIPDDFKYYPLTLTGLAADYRSGRRLGIWRLSEDDAKLLGLTVDKTIDERLDPELSSKAVAKQLKAYKNSYGSWIMAMAALFDSTALSTAILNADGELNYYRLYVPENLDKSMSQVIAGKILFSNPRTYGYNLHKSWPNLAKDRIRLGESGNMRTLAQKYKIDYKTFRDMNPHVLTDTVPSGAYLNIP
jgi:hypothetical protein